MSNKIGTVIELNTVEKAICKQLAKMRYENARNSGVKNSKIGSQSDEFTDLEGISGEFAFCKLFNIYPDLSIAVRSAFQGNDDGDGTLHEKKVDVKTTKYETGKLLAAPWKKTNVDIFALMTGVFPKYTFRGFMKSEELLQSSRLSDLGHGQGYMAYQQELREFHES
jgi:hypothetical protein